MEYENAQKRILRGVWPVEGAGQFQDRVFRNSCGRVGWPHAGGVRRSTNDSQFLLDAPRLVFQVRPVVRVEGAVRGELEVIAWRDSLKGK